MNWSAAQLGDDPAEQHANAYILASRIAGAFAATAAERDRQGGTAKRERDLLRDSGLLTLFIPERLGGWGASWAEILTTVRIVARADGSLAHLYGFQHLLLATLQLFGEPAQWEPWFRATVEQRWFWGNALNPLDRRARIRADGEAWRVDGSKGFCSGATDADYLIISALRDPDEQLIIAAIPSDRDGLRILDDWDNLGQRQTDSGTVEFHRLLVHEREILRNPGPLGNVFATLRSCIAQLTLTNLYLGIAEGAYAEARHYTHGQSRAWIQSGVDRPEQDPYVLSKYGNFWLELESARALTDLAAQRLDAAWACGEALRESQRGALALAIAAAKVAATRAGLKISAEMFEVMGARATAAGPRLDRYWRNLRVHTLHDPVEYKLRDLGQWALNHDYPAATFYS